MTTAKYRWFITTNFTIGSLGSLSTRRFTQIGEQDPHLPRFFFESFLSIRIFSHSCFLDCSHSRVHQLQSASHWFVNFVLLLSSWLLHFSVNHEENWEVKIFINPKKQCFTLMTEACSFVRALDDVLLIQKISRQHFFSQTNKLQWKVAGVKRINPP